MKYEEFNFVSMQMKLEYMTKYVPDTVANSLLTHTLCYNKGSHNSLLG